MKKGIELADCENCLLAEITDKGMKQKDVAQTYGLTLKSSECEKVNWPKVNQAIMDRWSKSGLIRIKKMAWSGRAFA